MKISTEIGSAAAKSGRERAVELCALAGFDGWDFSMFDMPFKKGLLGLPIFKKNQLNTVGYLKIARRLREIGTNNGIVCNQSHAPFPVSDASVRSFLSVAIECTAEAGGEICVIHPDNRKTAEQNREMFLSLLPLAKQCGVKIATENMWSWDKTAGHSCFAACATGEDFRHHIDIVGDDYLVACLDIGHAEMRGSGDGAVNMIKTLGHRIKALHIHDNDLLHDSHQIPFSMSIDFQAVAKALWEVGYSGYLTLEADSFLEPYGKNELLKGLVQLRESAERLALMLDGFGEREQ